MAIRIILLFLIIVAALLTLFTSHQSDKEFAKAKKHTAWSHIFLYIFLSLVFLGYMTGAFGINGYKMTAKGGTLSAEMTSNLGGSSPSDTTHPTIPPKVISQSRQKLETFLEGGGFAKSCSTASQVLKMLFDRSNIPAPKDS